VWRQETVVRRTANRSADQQTQGPEDGGEHGQRGGIVPLIPGLLPRPPRPHQSDGRHFGEAQVRLSAQGATAAALEGIGFLGT